MSAPILIATRRSPLALRQTEMVCVWLEERLSEVSFERLELSTQVDQRLKWSLEERGGIGLFTKELEEALLDRRATLAVHSAKDMPTTHPEGLVIAGYLPRARANDILVLRKDCPKPATIATSSPRRRAQLGTLFPEAKWTTIRGNVGTRLAKISKGECDASVLAAAGLDRLEISEHPDLVFRELPVEQVVPAPGQAAIAIQCRSEDLGQFKGRFCQATGRAVSLEKSFLQRLGSGCQIPLGAYFADACLHIFHPQVGYRSFELRIEDDDQIEHALDQVMESIEIEI